MRKLFLIGSLMISSTALAAPNAFYYDYAKVEHVERVYKPVTHTYYKNCHPGARRTDTAVTTFIGAMIGGAIGNAIGQNSSHKKLSTVAGAALGGSIAHDMARNQHSQSHCQFTQVTEPKLVGYKVRYRYKGERFYTMMDRRPGKKIKVKIQVTPAFKHG